MKALCAFNVFRCFLLTRNIPYAYEDRRPGSNRGGRERQAQERRDKFERMASAAPSSVAPADLSRLPAYINPKAVNVSKVIEQQEKRKLLWQGSKAKKEGETPSGAAASSSSSSPTKPADKAAVWQNVTFSGDSDGAVANKFKKLMGLKEGDGGTRASETSVSGTKIRNYTRATLKLFTLLFPNENESCLHQLETQ